VGVLLLAIVYPFFPKTGRLTLLDFAPCFVPGVISYYMLRNGLRGKLNAILWPMFVLAVVACFYVLPLNVKWPQWIFCLVVGLAIPQFREIKNRHLAAVSHWVAKYSYGIYLAHVSCLWLTFIVCRGLPLWLQWTLIGPIIAASAFVLFHTVESPMIKLGARIAEIHLPKRETALPASA
jgi:peptidoglycan/LPS O-acetylase OafA/YrhL